MGALFSGPPSVPTVPVAPPAAAPATQATPNTNASIAQAKMKAAAGYSASQTVDTSAQGVQGGVTTAQNKLLGA